MTSQWKKESDDSLIGRAYGDRGPLLGFTFIVKEYRWYALIVGLVYVPAMAWFLFGFSLVFVGLVYDDWL